jgi:hypothetical protein
MTSKPWRTVASVAIAMAAGVVTAAVATPKKSLPPAVAQAAPRAGQPVATVAVPPQRMSRIEAEAIIRQAEQVFANRTVSAATSSSGIRVAELGDGFSNVYLARINADGSVSAACVDNAASAATFLTAGAALEEK